ncbi:MAG: hypothetical protein KC635_23570 [Myxococcales bacterium]|nr:hypothetical protein [Myxococcales bacterium]
MGFVSAILLLLAGVLGAAGLIVAKRPDAKAAIDKLAPYQGWIGVVSALWGVWWLISWLMNLSIISHFMIWMITWLAVAVVMIALGILLGIGLMKTFVKDPRAQQKLDQSYARLAPKQGVIGIVAIGLGFWSLLQSILKIGIPG